MCISSTERTRRFGTDEASCFGPVHCLLPSIFMFYVMECTCSCYCCHGCCSCYPSNPYVVVARLASRLPLDCFRPPLCLSLVCRMFLSMHVILSSSYSPHSHLSITLRFFRLLGDESHRKRFLSSSGDLLRARGSFEVDHHIGRIIHSNSYRLPRESLIAKIGI